MQNLKMVDDAPEFAERRQSERFIVNEDTELTTRRGKTTVTLLNRSERGVGLEGIQLDVGEEVQFVLDGRVCDGRVVYSDKLRSGVRFK